MNTSSKVTELCWDLRYSGQTLTAVSVTRQSMKHSRARGDAQNVSDLIFGYVLAYDDLFPQCGTVLDTSHAASLHKIATLAAHR